MEVSGLNGLVIIIVFLVLSAYALGCSIVHFISAWYSILVMHIGLYAWFSCCSFMLRLPDRFNRRL